MYEKQMVSTTTIRHLIQQHYGMCLPVVVMRLEDDIYCYQQQHHEIPYPLWSSVNHYIRIFQEWKKHRPMIDIVVLDETTQSYRLVQDVCFKNSYEDEEAWHKAILELITENSSVWIVRHLD